MHFQFNHCTLIKCTSNAKLQGTMHKAETILDMLWSPPEIKIYMVLHKTSSTSGFLLNTMYRKSLSTKTTVQNT